MSDHDYMTGNAGQKFGFTMHDLLAGGFRHQRVFVLTFAGILLGSIVAALVVPPKYESITKILVKRERVDPVVSSEKTNPVMVQGSVSEEELNSEVELILSNDVLRKTVMDTGLNNRKQFLNFWPFKHSPEKQLALTVSHLKGDLKVEPLKIRYHPDHLQLFESAAGRAGTECVEQRLHRKASCGSSSFGPA